jgi:hypothetical protein
MALIEQEAPAEASRRLTVFNPVGYEPKVSPRPMAPRLETVNGQTIYLVDCRFDDSEKLLKQIQAWFAEHLPDVTTRLVQLGGVYGKDDPQLWARIKADGNAAIVGVGH